MTTCSRVLKMTKRVYQDSLNRWLRSPASATPQPSDTPAPTSSPSKSSVVAVPVPRPFIEEVLLPSHTVGCTPTATDTSRTQTDSGGHSTIQQTPVSAAMVLDGADDRLRIAAPTVVVHVCFVLHFTFSLASTSTAYCCQR